MLAGERPILGYRKTSYATAEDPDSERAKNQIRIRSREAPAERARSAYDGYTTAYAPDFGYRKTSYATAETQDSERARI